MIEEKYSASMVVLIGVILMVVTASFVHYQDGETTMLLNKCIHENIRQNSQSPLAICEEKFVTDYVCAKVRIEGNQIRQQLDACASDLKILRYQSEQAPPQRNLTKSPWTSIHIDPNVTSGCG